MGWTNSVLLGVTGNRSAIQETQAEFQDLELDIVELYERVSSQAEADQDHGARLEALEAENQELKVLVSSLARLLVNKGVLAAGEVETIVRVLDSADGQGEEGA